MKVYTIETTCDTYEWDDQQISDVSVRLHMSHRSYPLIRYEEAIQGYEALCWADKIRAEKSFNEFFSEDELPKIKKWLESLNYKCRATAFQRPVPAMTREGYDHESKSLHVAHFECDGDRLYPEVPGLPFPVRATVCWDELNRKANQLKDKKMAEISAKIQKLLSDNRVTEEELELFMGQRQPDCDDIPF